MYAAKVLFVFLLMCAQVDIVEGRRLPLDNALDDMRKRLQGETDFTTAISTDYFTEAPMITLLTSTAVIDLPASPYVTPATFPEDITLDTNFHSSIAREVLDLIAQ